MADSLKLTDDGKKLVDRARRQKGWNKFDEDWCTKANVADITLKRFWKPVPIWRTCFIPICDAVGVDWQSVCTQQQGSSNTRWFIKLEVTDFALVSKIVSLLENLSRDKIKIIERYEGSIVLLLESTLEAYERIEYLFRQGQLDDLLGVTVLSVRLKPVGLGEWLLGNFVEAMNLGWQVPPTGFASATTVRRVKEVYLTDDISVRLILSIEEETEQFFRVVVVVLPDTEIRNVLPLGLRLQVFSQEDEFLGEDVVEAADEPLRIEIGELEREELFRLSLLLDNEEYSEEFIV